MRVSIIAMTDIDVQNMSEATGGRWQPEPLDDDGSSLAEFAGRACYQSWSRPNPKTATNEGYMANILIKRHLSVVEHASVTFLITDVSRSLTHELVRHRHASFSQLSQRYVDMAGVTPIVPPLYRDPHDGGVDIETTEVIESLWRHACTAYDKLYELWHDRLTARGVTGFRATKMAREAARCVLPNMTPTQLVMTMNHRAFREWLVKRGSIDADHEIRNLAIDIHRLLTMVEPNMYQDIVRSSVNIGGQTYPILREVPIDNDAQ